MTRSGEHQSTLDLGVHTEHLETRDGCSSGNVVLQITLALMGILMLLGSIGCHRQYYRKQADMEAHQLIDQNALRVARPPNQPLRIDVDRRSRMFNPFDLDFQPMPLDDPASYQYMQCVDGRRGYPMWEAAGFTNTVESPDWWQFLPLDEDGVLSLNMENSVKIALLHSPEYQQQIEQLYLSALAVSSQRFVFDTQFFGGADTFFTLAGRRRSGANGRSQSAFSVGPDSTSAAGNRDFSLERRFASGSQLIVGLANNIVWNVSGPNTQSASTTLDFAFLQPLLRGAGRDVVMEDLTQAERALLADVRSFERFRRSFFLNITVGRQLEGQPQSVVNEASGNLNINVAGQGGFGNANGFLGLLQSQLRIRNLEENIARQAENLLILEDSLIELLTTIPDDAGSIVRQRLLVAQTRQSLLTAQRNLVNQQASYQQSVDAFLITMGLPPYLCIRLDDPILNRFELIDRRLLTRRQELSALRSSVGELNVKLFETARYKIDEESGLPVSEVEWSEEISQTLKRLRDEIAPLKEFNRTLIDEEIPRIAEDIDAYEKALPKRRRDGVKLLDLYEQEKEGICGLLNVTDIDDSIFALEELDELSDGLRQSYVLLEKRFESYEETISKLQATLESFTDGRAAELNNRELAKTLRDDIILETQQVLTDLGDDVLALQLIQARARTESLLLPEVEMDPQTAFYIARRNRRDYANAKARIVDAWRSIEVAADDLESQLDLVVNGDVQNVGNNPLDLRSSTSQLRIGLQWDAPITRLTERNTYRERLIRFEQIKRDFYQFEDSLWQLLRGEVRQLQANRLTFELGRQAIRIAASQIELNADIRALNDARGQGAGPTAAIDAIRALDALLQAQNDLLDIFVGYEVTRRGLDFDLGTMELTPDGLWIDPGKLTSDSLISLVGTTEGGMMQNACNECCLPNRPLPQAPVYFEPMVLGEVNATDFETTDFGDELRMLEANESIGELSDPSIEVDSDALRESIESGLEPTDLPSEE
ncbi:hypothetical protein [Rubripirellula amarantea]|nr:hypothetical protein [Rubripirellula amarantea]